MIFDKCAWGPALAYLGGSWAFKGAAQGGVEGDQGGLATFAVVLLRQHRGQCWPILGGAGSWWEAGESGMASPESGMASTLGGISIV